MTGLMDEPDEGDRGGGAVEDQDVEARATDRGIVGSTDRKPGEPEEKGSAPAEERRRADRRGIGRKLSGERSAAAAVVRVDRWTGMEKRDETGRGTSGP